MSNPYTEYTPEHKVWEIAQEKGKNAASWVFDGNTTRDTYEHVLKGIDEGDPMVLDAYRVPDLGEEFGGDYTEDELMEDVGWVPNDGTELRNDLANQYITEVGTAFWNEVERMCHVNLAPGDEQDGDDHDPDCDGTITTHGDGFGGQDRTFCCMHPSHGEHDHEHG